MPPWAQLVEPAATTSLVTTMTEPRSRHSSAAVSPAIPEPMTTTSTSRTQPGGSVDSRWGRTGSSGKAGNVGAGASLGSMGLMVSYPEPSEMTPPSPGARGWFDTWIECSYGVDGFWRRHWPDAHFRTAAQSPLLADALLAVLDRLEVGSVVDVGAGRGELLTSLAARRPGLRLAGIELRPRPAGVPESVAWAEDCWDVRPASWTSGRAAELLDGADPVLVVASEWLDDLPCRLVNRAPDGWRELVVDAAGVESAGPRLTDDDDGWADRWWPSGTRAEIGLTRDRAWSGLAAVVTGRGGALAMIDYGHHHDTRPDHGSFAAYRDGRAVDPTPSAELNLTAHVAVDAVRAAGEAAGLRRCSAAARTRPWPGCSADPSSDPDPLHDLVRRTEREALASRLRLGQPLVADPDPLTAPLGRRPSPDWSHLRTTSGAELLTTRRIGADQEFTRLPPWRVAPGRFCC